MGLCHPSDCWQLGLYFPLLTYGPPTLALCSIIIGLFFFFKSKKNKAIKVASILLSILGISFFIWFGYSRFNFYEIGKKNANNDLQILKQSGLTVYVPTNFPDGSNISKTTVIKQENGNDIFVIFKPKDQAKASIYEFSINEKFAPPNCGPREPSERFSLKCKLLFTTPLGRSIYREVNVNNQDMESGIVFIKINSTLITIYPSPETTSLSGFADSFKETSVDSLTIEPSY